MTKKDFNSRVKEMCDFVKAHKYDAIGGELIQRNIRDPFTYGTWCERNFEMNLREDYERKTTYTSDFSIAEWCVPVEGMQAIASTLRNALQNWRDSIEFFAEIVIVLNMKAWEHHARGSQNYSRMYSELYLMAKDLYFDWFDSDNKQHKEAMQYYYDYVD
jgi:hypothetical protein